jgi:predicted RNase H-like HicB family nuclease
MKPYAFKVIVEPDEDRWFAYCPVLEKRGGAAWGYSKEEALKNIQEVVQMAVESMVEHNEVIPEEPKDEVQVFSEPLVAVTVGL